LRLNYVSEGSRVRHASERKSFALHPMKKLRKHESSKFNDSSPPSAFSKGSKFTLYIFISEYAIIYIFIL